MLDKEVIEISQLIGLVLNTTSSFCGILTFIMVLVLNHHKPTMGHHISFQLSLWIGSMDFFYHFSKVLTDTLPILRDYHPRWLLEYLRWSCSYFPLACTILIACVAFDLHITFLKTTPNKTKYAKFYTPFSLIFTFLVTFPFFFVLRPKFDEVFSASSDNPTVTTLTYFFCYSLWMIMAIVYCAWVVIAVSLKLYRGVQELKAISSYSTIQADYFDVALHQTVRRLVFYPVIPIFCQTINMFDCLIPGFSDVREMVLLAYFMASFQGMLNFLVFLLNPTVASSWRNLKKSVIRHYIQQVYADGSQSKISYSYSLRPFNKVADSEEDLVESEILVNDSVLNDSTIPKFSFYSRCFTWIIKNIFITEENFPVYTSKPRHRTFRNSSRRFDSRSSRSIRSNLSSAPDKSQISNPIHSK